MVYININLIPVSVVLVHDRSTVGMIFFNITQVVYFADEALHIWQLFQILVDSGQLGVQFIEIFDRV